MFGSVVTAMVTPFAADGSVDLTGCATLAEHLVDLGNDGLVVNGTTGEASTTTDEEKAAIVRATVEAVGDRAFVTAGVGTNDTAHTVHLAQQARQAGAHGLLAVTPYYSKPPQAGVQAHFEALADSTDLPVMLYDIPGRSGIPIDVPTLIALAAHDRIVAVKDAKGDLAASAAVLAATDLLWYSGDDPLTLPFLSLGASGVVSVTGHLIADQLARLIQTHKTDPVAARDVFFATLPVADAIFTHQGVISTKAALRAQGLPVGGPRLPLVDLTEAQSAVLLERLREAGVRFGG